MIPVCLKARLSIIATVHPPVEYQPDNGAMCLFILVNTRASGRATCGNQRETMIKVDGRSDSFLISLDPSVNLPERWRTFSPTS